MNGDDCVEAKLQKWGNSVGIRIPHSIIKELNIKINDWVNIEKIDDKIIMTKQVNPKISLEERFMAYEGDNLAKDFTWDEPCGHEIW